MGTIELIKGDITKLQVDAIVNAANRSLLGGGGVDGAIHHAAGPELEEECSTLNGCEPGQAKITKGYRLHAKYVIHAVGPMWRGGHMDEDLILGQCYDNALTLAVQHDLKTLAFPAISTGVYGYPKKMAADIAVTRVARFLKTHPSIEKVIFAVFDDENEVIYRSRLQQLNTQ